MLWMMLAALRNHIQHFGHPATVVSSITVVKARACHDCEEGSKFGHRWKLIDEISWNAPCVNLCRVSNGVKYGVTDPSLLQT